LAVAKGIGLEIWDIPRRKILWDSNQEVEFLAFHPYKNIVATCREKKEFSVLQCIDLDTKKNIFRVDKRDIKTIERQCKMRIVGFKKCAFSPDGKFIITANHSATMSIWESQTGKHINTIRAYDNGAINFCTYSHKGDFIATVGKDETAKLWDAGTLKTLKIFKGHLERVLYCAFSSDDKRLITVSKDNTVQIWDTDPNKTSRALLTLKGHRDDVRYCAFSPDDTKIVTCSYDGILMLWKASNWK